MNPNDFLAMVLDAQSIKDGDAELKAIEDARAKVETILKKQYGSKITVKYGGSKAKGTMIKENYDLDILCYFENDDNSAGNNLEEIYNDVAKTLEKEYHVEKKNSAIRIWDKKASEDFHIDVVPGRYDENKEDAFLHQNDSPKARLKTNPEKHIKFIQDSGRKDVIKLVKIWREHKGFGLKTFILELLVIGVLKTSQDREVYDKLLTNFFKELSNNIESIKIEDPANPTGNDLSAIFNSNAKDTLKTFAKQALDAVRAGKWDGIFGQTTVIAPDAVAKNIQIIKSKNPTPSKPYLA
jgi:hypothetical protein